MDRKSLEAQLASLQAQELQAIHALGEIRGAITTLRAIIPQLPPDPEPAKDEDS